MVYVVDAHIFAMLLLITINQLTSQFKNISLVMHLGIKLKNY
jgi:hypothetical protein